MVVQPEPGSIDPGCGEGLCRHAKVDRRDAVVDLPNDDMPPQIGPPDIVVACNPELAVLVQEKAAAARPHALLDVAPLSHPLQGDPGSLSQASHLFLETRGKAFEPRKRALLHSAMIQGSMLGRTILDVGLYEIFQAGAHGGAQLEADFEGAAGSALDPALYG